MTRFGSGAFAFEFHDATSPPRPGVTYPLMLFSSQTGCAVEDLAFTYVGTGPSDAMQGAFTLEAGALSFTPSLAAAELVFRDDFGQPDPRRERTARPAGRGGNAFETDDS